MLSLHRMDVVGIAVVYNDNLDTNQWAELCPQLEFAPSRPLSTIQFDEVELSTMLLRSTLILNSSAQRHRLPRSTFDIAYSANHSSCHSCLRRSCTLSGAVHRTVRFRMEKVDTTTFCSQFDLQTSTWFDHSAEDSSQTVSYLVRRLRSALRSSSSFQLYVPSSSLIQQLRNINRRFASVSRIQQCRTLSTNCTTSAMSNSIDYPSWPILCSVLR